MFLSDNEIKKYVQEGRITISDFDEKRLNPCSYDICLWNKFIVTDTWRTPIIDPDKKIAPITEEILVNDGDEFILHPWVSVLGIAKDYYGSNEFLILLYGKSSLARIGITVHNTAPIMNPWHFLNPIFELCNLNSVPVILRPWMKIAQILFWSLSSVPNKQYPSTWRYTKDNYYGWIPEKVKNWNI